MGFRAAVGVCDRVVVGTRDGDWGRVVGLRYGDAVLRAEVAGLMSPGCWVACALAGVKSGAFALASAGGPGPSSSEDSTLLLASSLLSRPNAVIKACTWCDM